MTARILPPEEWPRLLSTGCRVDHQWRDRSRNGCVVVVEQMRDIIASAFVFLADDARVHVDGLWIDARFRRSLRVLRPLRQAIHRAVSALGASLVIVPSDATWMRTRTHAVKL